MKKLIAICLLMATAFSVNAQNAPLNKQQTLDYIEKLFKASFYWPTPGCKVEAMTLESKLLVYSVSPVCAGKPHRIDLSKIKTLNVEEQIIGDLVFYNIYGEDKKESVLSCIQSESDAKRLKKALEHLIEILKTEKSTDPFGE